ncbi:MAG: hypothetical protein QXH37_04645, partial [Candidatus Bathyarchaeia archaeon]
MEGVADQRRILTMYIPQWPSSCPECGSIKLWKDGLRRTSQGPVQRYVCRSCGHRFSDPGKAKARKGFNNSDASNAPQRISSMILKSHEAIAYYRQICAAQPMGAKNLATAIKESEKRAVGATEQTAADVKGKILEFAWWMKKQGYADATIEGRVQI